MTSPFSFKQQSVEKAYLTAEKILHLAKRESGFAVSRRYRDEWLHKRCFALVKKRCLRKKYSSSHIIYYALEKGPAERNSKDEQ